MLWRVFGAAVIRGHVGSVRTIELWAYRDFPTPNCIWTASQTPNVAEFLFGPEK